MKRFMIDRDSNFGVKMKVQVLVNLKKNAKKIKSAKTKKVVSYCYEYGLKP